ncbi:MAG: hypothetical protein J7M27_08655 [Candidatus Latescibacteria bacterium]|nr:hypothetical protein [Candidatus Latescibacterota bacterium]
MNVWGLAGKWGIPRQVPPDGARLDKQKMTLQLDKRGERWKLKAVRGLVNTMKTAVKAK